MELHSNVHRRSISTNAMPLSVSLFLFSLPFPFSLSLSLLVTLRLDTRSSMKFFVGSFPRDIFDSLLLLLYPSSPPVVVIKTNEKRRKEKRNPFRLTLAKKQEQKFHERYRGWERDGFEKRFVRFQKSLQLSMSRGQRLSR